MMSKPRYSEFKDDIDVDALEAALGFVPFATDRGEDRGHCLFPDNHAHGDSTGKFSIHRDKKLYNCWVCGGGSLLSLVMEYHDWDVDQATSWLVQFAVSEGTRTDTEYRDYLIEMLSDIEQRTDVMPYFNPRVLERFKGPVDYFRSRGIADEIIDAYHLCYSNTVLKVAPVKNNEKIDDDYYGPAAIFPHYWNDKLVGWQHRWMDWDEQHTKVPRWLAKYTNTTDFPKDSTLFNYDVVCQVEEPVVVVESVPTVLFLASNGVPAVSYFGSKPKPAQLRLLRKLGAVILAPDNDSTGDTLVNSAGKYLERYMDVLVAEKVQLGPKTDLGDYIKTKDPAERLHDHLQNRVHPLGVKVL